MPRICPSVNSCNVFLKLLLFDKKSLQKFCCLNKKHYLCNRNSVMSQLLMGYGVMVTLQILVLSFLVRIRVSQRLERQSHLSLFCFCVFSSFIIYVSLQLEIDCSYSFVIIALARKHNCFWSRRIYFSMELIKGKSATQMLVLSC